MIYKYMIISQMLTEEILLPNHGSYTVIDIDTFRIR